MSEASLVEPSEHFRKLLSPIHSVGPPKRPRSGRSALKPGFIEKGALVGDIAVVLLASLASAILYKILTPEVAIKNLGIFIIGAISALNFVIVNVARRNYRLKKLLLVSVQFREVATVWAVVCGLMAIGAFTMKISSDYSRGATIIFVLMSMTLLLSWRIVVAKFITKMLASDAFAKRKIIVIAEKDRAVSSRSLQELRRLGFVPVAVCGLSEIEMSSSGASSSLRAKLIALVELARAERAEGFYILIGWNYHRAIDVVLQALNTLALPVHLLPDESAARFLSRPVVEIGNTWTVTIKRPPLSQYELGIKRVFDLVGALAGLTILAPLFMITAILIKLDSKGPVFFRQTRNGFNGHTFSIFKFRTMLVLEDGPNIKQASRDDPRITRLGRWLRRTSIDELPQLLNVLEGSMSLVGPRPHACSHNSSYEKKIANYAFRHHVKPGLTGWAQVNGFRGETIEIAMMEKRVDHDLWYINNWSLRLDIWITIKTAMVSVFQRTAY